MSEIEVCGVCKSFKKTQALKDISFSVEKGEIFGLIGPDGAGKTSLFRILTTLSVPDSGSAKVSIYGVDTMILTPALQRSAVWTLRRTMLKYGHKSVICPDISLCTKISA